MSLATPYLEMDTCRNMLLENQKSFTVNKLNAELK